MTHNEITPQDLEDMKAELTRREESILWDIEQKAGELFTLNRQLMEATEKFEQNLVANTTPITPQVRETSKIEKVYAELKQLSTAAGTYMQINTALVDDAVTSGIAEAKKRADRHR